MEERDSRPLRSAEPADQDPHRPLEPGPPMRMLDWVRRHALSGDTAPRRIWVQIALSILVTLAIATWGFLELAVTPPLGFASSFYHALRVYTLDLGPAAEGSTSPDWQLWVALILAAALVARGLMALARNQLAGRATTHLLRGHVIVCGGGVHGSRLVQAMSDRHDVVLVDVDPRSRGLQAPRGKFEWRLVGDAVRAGTLIMAGISRANWLVAITGNDFINSQIVSTVRDLSVQGQVRDCIHILVQTEDPSLTRFLEEDVAYGRATAPGPTPVVTSFSANAIAADALLTESRRKVAGAGGTAPLLVMQGTRGPSLLLAGDHDLLDAIVLAALRRWSVRVLRELESDSRHARPPMHISLLGAEAVARVERLRVRWQLDPAVLMIEGRDCPRSSELGTEVHDWLLTPHRADHAIVACKAELEGVGMTLELSRALGDDVLMTRITTDLESVFDMHLEQRTAASPRLATTEVKSIADLAYDPEAMRHLAGPRRLQQALTREFDAAEATRVSIRLFNRPELGLHSDRAWRIRECERAWLQALLDPVPLSAVVRAGLAVDLASPQNLRTVAEQLSERAQHANAFGAWCEYARRVDADSLAELASVAGADRTAEIAVRLRRATLGDLDAISELAPDGSVLIDAPRVAIFVGAAGSMSAAAESELERLLERGLVGYDGMLLSGGTGVGVPGVVGRVARKLGIGLVGYAPRGRADRDLYPVVRETPDANDFSMLEPLAMWTEILNAGIDLDWTRVVVCPGGTITTGELQLARALGARVGWLDPAGEAGAPLDELLPLGASGVLELPPDPMTIRAFIKWSSLSPELRELVAKHLHNNYRRKHRRRKPPEDAALAPWDDLLSSLQESNRAQADDIPNKLELIGARLSCPGRTLELTQAQIELLAEVEHGRWNVERMQAGWTSGLRHAGRGVSPDLRPWSELDEETRAFDREAVCAMLPALRETGWGIEMTDRKHT